MKSTIKCVIIDDDQFAIDILIDHIQEISELEIQATFTDPILALTTILQHQEPIDILFLDVDMPKLSGIDLAENVRKKVKNIIFTTAFSDYAIKAFDLRAKHYLLKPIELSKFLEAIREIISDDFQPRESKMSDNESYYLRTGERGKLTRVDKNEIIYIQAAMNYVDLQTKDKRYTIYMTMKEMEEVLKDDDRFFRVHKSYIINTDYISQIRGNTIELGKYQALMTNPYKGDFLSYIDQKTLISKRI
ncbi:hypothetical protein AQ505_08920 [Pedobacter sp. PACM 27299]|uniref:LytR/AlgR family response regulator transcription factor n=1 Tax=Pedobacter sp. PACM 27299 TaxID=1727164 RepID=UPI000705A6FA|nr:LytTR family DNA-binding domain-containing protein [Pedobacter sp. PACM 27299]ALL05603.1 hypothetical protein AQ505_08920 [Pedobacter sp. PACM 27299]